MGDRGNVNVNFGRVDIGHNILRVVMTACCENGAMNMYGRDLKMGGHDGFPAKDGALKL